MADEKPPEAKPEAAPAETPPAEGAPAEAPAEAPPAGEEAAPSGEGAAPVPDPKEELKKQIEGDIKLDVIRKIVQKEEEKKEEEQPAEGVAEAVEDAVEEVEDFFAKHKVPIMIFLGVIGFLVMILVIKSGFDNIAAATVAEIPEQEVVEKQPIEEISFDNKQLYREQYAEKVGEDLPVEHSFEMDLRDSLKVPDEVKNDHPKAESEDHSEDDESDHKDSDSHDSKDHESDDSGFNFSVSNIIGDIDFDVSDWFVGKLKSSLNLSEEEHE